VRTVKFSSAIAEYKYTLNSMDGAVYEPDLKRRKFHDDDQIVENFAQWMCERKFEMSPKVKMSKTGSCARYGLIAVHPVEKGDILFKIPRYKLVCACVAPA